MNWSRFSFRKTRMVFSTQGRAAKNADLDALKMACCAVAEQYQAVDTAQALASKSLTAALSDSSGELQSQTVGSWSKSYRSGGESAAQAATVFLFEYVRRTTNLKLD